MIQQFRCLVIDDDIQSNLIVKLSIKKYLDLSDILILTTPSEGLEWIRLTYSPASTECNTLLLLDINMPGMSGWEFFDKFEKFDINIQKQFAIFMFSSSVDERDLAIAKSHKNVKGYLIKPLKKQSLLELIDKLNE